MQCWELSEDSFELHQTRGQPKVELYQGQQVLAVNRDMVNILGFEGCMFSVSTRLCPCSGKLPSIIHNT